MQPANPLLPPGYSPVPPDHVANVATFLEMTERPRPKPADRLRGNADLQPLGGADADLYRTLFRAVGEPWLWGSRLALSDEELRAILQDPRVEAYAMRCDGDAAGLLELDFRAPRECELSFFGLAREFIGHGFGRWLMEKAIAMAWEKPIRRFWVHTCTLDHPGALDFYRRSGFRPYAFAVEVMPDPRLRGLLARTAAPQVPLLA